MRERRWEEGECVRGGGRRERKGRRSDRGEKNGDQMGEEGGLGGGLLVGRMVEKWPEGSVLRVWAATGLAAYCLLAEPRRGSALLSWGS